MKKEAILAVVPQLSTQSEAFFRLSVISRDMLAQALGEPLILSDCIQALGTIVSEKKYHMKLLFHWRKKQRDWGGCSPPPPPPPPPPPHLVNQVRLNLGRYLFY